MFCVLIGRALHIVSTTEPVIVLNHRKVASSVNPQSRRMLHTINDGKWKNTTDSTVDLDRLAVPVHPWSSSSR
jgi:hydrogenase maturation factor HypE